MSCALECVLEMLLNLDLKSVYFVSYSRVFRSSTMVVQIFPPLGGFLLHTVD